MLRRNSKVYDYRMSVLDNRPNDYDKLPSYDVQMRRFWWRMEKFDQYLDGKLVYVPTERDKRLAAREKLKIENYARKFDPKSELLAHLLRQKENNERQD